MANSLQLYKVHSFSTYKQEAVGLLGMVNWEHNWKEAVELTAHGSISLSLSPSSNSSNSLSTSLFTSMSQPHQLSTHVTISHNVTAFNRAHWWLSDCHLLVTILLSPQCTNKTGFIRSSDVKCHRHHRYLPEMEYMKKTNSWQDVPGSEPRLCLHKLSSNTTQNKLKTFKIKLKWKNMIQYTSDSGRNRQLLMIRWKLSWTDWYFILPEQIISNISVFHSFSSCPFMFEIWCWTLQ